MEGNILPLTLTIFIFLSFALADSFFYLHDSVESSGAASSDSLSLDESFFACDRNPSCRSVQRSKKGIEVATESIWRKVTFRSCSDALKQTDTKEGIFLVHPDKVGYPVEVKCMKDNGLVKVVFDHDSERKIYVNESEEAASFKHKIVYKNQLQSIIRFVELSQSCRQFTRIDCHKMLLFYKDYIGYLVDRKGKRIDHIGGGPANGRGCECGITGTCAKAGTLCNCDANDNVMRFDEGYVTDRSRLPITEVRLGDTGASSEYGAFRIGKLECVT